MKELKKSNIISRFKESAYEFKKVRNISLLAVFSCLMVILNFLVVEMSSIISISFEFISVCLVGVMFGPVVGFIFGFFSDILCYFIHPIGAFYMWYAVSVAVDGLIYGMFLYKTQLSAKRVVCVQITRDILTNVILNSIFIWMQFGGNFIHMLIFMRIPKNIIKIPINCVLIWFLIKHFKRIVKR